MTDRTENVGGEFRTKGGRCVVTADRLRIERTTRLDGLDALTESTISPLRRLGVALLPVAGAAGGVLLARALPPWLAGVVAGLLLVLIVRWAYRTAKHAGDEIEIPLADVESVEPQYGLPPLTRPRFVIRYRSEGGVKQRYVLTPSRLYGFGAYERGKELFAEKGLLDAEATRNVESE